MSGVLPIALEDAVKIVRVMTHTTKEYVALMELHSEVSDEDVRRVVREFIGDIYQKPPLRSSVKRSIRVRRVHDIEILDHSKRWYLLRITTDPGTYIRKLIHDIGLVLGVGAHMRELRRTRSGVFREDLNLVTLHQLSEAAYIYKTEGDESYLRRYIMPIEYGISHLPKIVIDTNAVDPIARGAQLAVPGVVLFDKNINRGDIIALLSPKGELVALARALMSSEEIALNNKGLVSTTMRVIMRPGVYPRWEKKNKIS
ncbi:MAG: RNA-guided pseudouridylation complex pseudouridine synthase subunit Cbf5 [Sulfolobales archaeon]